MFSAQAEELVAINFAMRTLQVQDRYVAITFSNAVVHHRDSHFSSNSFLEPKLHLVWDE